VPITTNIVSSNPAHGVNSDGQEFYQYQQNKQGKFNQWWSTILQISKKNKQESLNSDGQQFHKYINKTNKESLNSVGQQFYQYQQKKQWKFKQWLSIISPISTKQTGKA